MPPSPQGVHHARVDVALPRSVQVLLLPPSPGAQRARFASAQALCADGAAAAAEAVAPCRGAAAWAQHGGQRRGTSVASASPRRGLASMMTSAGSSIEDGFRWPMAFASVRCIAAQQGVVSYSSQTGHNWPWRTTLDGFHATSPGWRNARERSRAFEGCHEREVARRGWGESQGERSVRGARGAGEPSIKSSSYQVIMLPSAQAIKLSCYHIIKLSCNQDFKWSSYPCVGLSGYQTVKLSCAIKLS